MEFTHIQLSRIAAAAASVWGKDKETTKDDDQLEKNRLDNLYSAVARLHRKAQTADKPENGFMA